MKANEYVNAVDHLKFSVDLASRVRAAEGQRPKFRLTRAAVLAAVLCMLLATTAAAAGIWFSREVELENIGTVAPDGWETLEMSLCTGESGDGVTVHRMKLNSDDYFLFGNGLLYSHESGFLRVEPDYRLTELESKQLSLSLEKDGFAYSQELCFVETENGLVSDQMLDYPLVDGKALVNLWHGNERCWPVWVDISTGELEDALPDFRAEDFEGEVRYSRMFRGGILLTCLTAEQNNVLYWVEQRSTDAVKVEKPDGANFFVMDDEICYRDSDWNYWKTAGGWDFYAVEGVPKTSDAMWNGLITCVSQEETLQVYDLLKETMYDIPGISAFDPWIQEDPQYDPVRAGFNATRNSADGCIVVTHDYHDWENLRRMVDSIAWLDLDTMELKHLDVHSDQGVWTFGWLDDTRYCVISMDDESRYLTIYEFDA